MRLVIKCFWGVYPKNILIVYGIRQYLWGGILQIFIKIFFILLCLYSFPVMAECTNNSSSSYYYEQKLGTLQATGTCPSSHPCFDTNDGKNGITGCYRPNTTPGKLWVCTKMRSAPDGNSTQEYIESFNKAPCESWAEKNCNEYIKTTTGTDGKYIYPTQYCPGGKTYYPGGSGVNDLAPLASCPSGFYADIDATSNASCYQIHPQLKDGKGQPTYLNAGYTVEYDCSKNDTCTYSNSVQACGKGGVLAKMWCTGGDAKMYYGKKGYLGSTSICPSSGGTVNAMIGDNKYYIHANVSEWTYEAEFLAYSIGQCYRSPTGASTDTWVYSYDAHGAFRAPADGDYANKYYYDTGTKDYTNIRTSSTSKKRWVFCAKNGSSLYGLDANGTCTICTSPYTDASGFTASMSNLKDTNGNDLKYSFSRCLVNLGDNEGNYIKNAKEVLTECPKGSYCPPDMRSTCLVSNGTNPCPNNRLECTGITYASVSECSIVYGSLINGDYLIPYGETGGIADCPAGTANDSTGATHASACKGCPRNTYSSKGSSVCTVCVGGKKTTAGNSTSCVDCSNNTNAKTWGSWGTWTYSSNSISGTEGCQIITCESGIKGTNAYSVTGGVSETGENSKCLYVGTCLAGYTNPTQKGSDSAVNKRTIICSDCPANSYCPDGNTNPTSCSTPYGQSGMNSKRQEDCYLTLTAGYYIPNAKDSPQSCPKGYKCPGGDTIHYGGIGGQTACNNGYYQDGTGQSDCRKCLVGTYTANDGKAYTACTECPAGTYQDKEGQDGCIPCPKGTYQPNKKQTFCNKCKAGATTSGTGSTFHTGCLLTSETRFCDNSGQCFTLSFLDGRNVKQQSAGEELQ